MITINGVFYSGNGNSISVRNNKVIIDGVDVTPDSKTISIVVNGDVKEIEAECEVRIKGNVGRVKTTNGDIEIDGDVLGDIETTNGNVRTKTVKGSVKTKNGNIYN